ncbi:MAG: CehA/McbA family metallohydrolase [bacterium]|nr:CehA/McbA family metallohydrolase [bacterium]
MKSLSAALLALLMSTVVFGQSPQPAEKWYKGNTHTHTLNTDGRDVPYDVAKWYREHGYNFVVITDHEYITGVEPLNTLLGRTGSFLVISGQEVTDSSERKPIHANGLGLTKVVMPSKLANKVESLQKNIDNIRAAGGIPQLNHPNFGWALSSAEIRQVKGLRLMEIYNGHPMVNNLGGGGSPSAEAIWDELLTAGMLIYGIGDDDVHQLQSRGEAIEALPGQAWIYVRAPELTSSAILTAIDTGNFYSSTGVELTDYKADQNEVSIKVKASSYSKYRVQFIGGGGKILQESLDPSAVYKVKGDEGYVRVKVLESNGKIAWTQPLMLR